MSRLAAQKKKNRDMDRAVRSALREPQPKKVHFLQKNPSKTRLLMGRFLSPMGRCPTLMGRFTECLNGPFSLLKIPWKTAHEEKAHQSRADPCSGILAVKLPNSDLNFAVDFVWIFPFCKKGPQNPPKNPPQNSSGEFVRKNPLVFLQRPFLDH